MTKQKTLENSLLYTDHHIRIRYFDDSVEFYNDSKKVALLFLEMNWMIPNADEELQTVCYLMFSTLLVGGGTLSFKHEALDNLFDPNYAPTDGTDFPEEYLMEIPETATRLKYHYTRFHPDNEMHFCVYAYVHFLK